MARAEAKKTRIGLALSQVKAIAMGMNSSSHLRFIVGLVYGLIRSYEKI
jgi:hypothetical protein